MTGFWQRMAMVATFGTTLLAAHSVSEGGLEELFEKITGTDKTQVRDGDADMGLPAYDGIRHAVGVVDFKNQSGWHGHWKLGYNLSIMLESALADTGRFVLVEREKLGAILAEQDLVASGRAAKASDIAQTGKVRPAKYIATGALTEVEHSESGGKAKIRIGPVTVGGKKEKAQITIIAKLVDSTTGEIVVKKRIVGKAGRAKANLGIHEGKFDGNFSAFAKTTIADAAQDCINQAARFFATELEEFPASGAVVVVKDGRVIINRGEVYNFQPGTILSMTEEGEELIDPETGEVLEKAEGREIGKIRITRDSEKISYCEVIEGETDPARGTQVNVVSIPKEVEEVEEIESG